MTEAQQITHCPRTGVMNLPTMWMTTLHTVLRQIDVHVSLQVSNSPLAGLKSTFQLARNQTNLSHKSHGHTYCSIIPLCLQRINCHVPDWIVSQLCAVLASLWWVSARALPPRGTGFTRTYIRECLHALWCSSTHMPGGSLFIKSILGQIYQFADPPVCTITKG